jgi:type IV secretory pathway TraG/TraD family ATPase VirD4
MAPLIKFICESLIMELMTAYDDAPDSRKAQSRNILWSMDEAGRIGIPNLPEHASTVVGRKITLSMSAQDRSQFTAVYGRDRTTNLFTNIRTQLVFSQADLDTAKHYSERMGETSGYAHSESEHGGETTSTGKSERGIPVMSLQEFIDMDDGEAVCFMGKKIKPFRIKSMDARRHPLLAKRLGMKQPELLRLPPLAESQVEKRPAPKPPPLPSWHYDPQLFRKWPQMAESRGEGEHLQEQTEVNKVSLGL